MTMPIPQPILTALEILQQGGFEAFLVGGCVRDYLLQRDIHDYDITTNALPSQTKELFSDYAVHETGIKHGTVLVVIQHCPIEITTYRYEGSYKDHRHPDEVHFTTSLKEDLARRDFTMNALVYSTQKGVVDYFHGREDLQRKTVRAIGVAEKRFDEDALRIMRGLRFASQLGFSIEESTLQAMDTQKELLKVISKERITDEFLKFLSGEYFPSTQTYADVILPVVFPDYPKDSTILFKSISKIQNSTIRLALWAQSISLSNTLILPKKTIALVDMLQRYLPLTPKSRYEIKCILKEIGEEAFTYLLEYYSIFYPDQYPQIQTSYQEIKASHAVYSLSRLAVNGNQLQLLGYQGKNIKEALDWLLEEVMKEHVENTSETLLNHLTSKKAEPF